MGKTAMHPLDNTTRFFAVVGAPYIPEAHFDDGRDETPERLFSLAEFELARRQATHAAAWWPRKCN